MTFPFSSYSTTSSRVIGSYPADSPPCLVVFAGVHGNEPSGVIALRRILEQLRAKKIPLQGAITGVLGNQVAFHQGVRYVDEDLNRLFLPAYIDQVLADSKGRTVEACELLAVREQVAVCERGNTAPFFVDCHTTSSASIPYISLNEGFADSYRFAQGLPATAVIGVEKEIKGCLAEWLNRRGWHGFTFEAGQHQSALAVQSQEAIIWLALVQAGCLQPENAPEPLANARRILSQQGSQQEKVYRTVSSYRIRPDEQFRMLPGYVNLQEVQRGEQLAISDGEPVYATEDAHILMPLYQKQGNFGFFMAQEITDYLG